MKKAAPYLLLQLIVLLYSMGSVCSKAAAGRKFLSPEWLLLYGALILILCVYALFWQQILKKLPLNTAYACKSVTVIWGIIWGALIFGESVTVTRAIGAVLVLIGVVLMVAGTEGRRE